MFKSVLVADGNVASRTRFKEIFCTLGHKCDCVSSWESVCTRLCKEPPSLLILEQEVVSQREPDALQKLGRLPAGMQIVLLTRETPSQGAIPVIQGLGVSAVLKKDFTNHFMLKAILEIARDPSEKVEESAYYGLGKVLAVDDSPEARAVLKTFLELRGLDVDVVSDGTEALQEARRRRPKLVLLDVMMPGMDGLTVLAKLKEIERSIRVAMLSGLTEEALAREAYALGACDFLGKPFDFKKLEALVLSILALEI